MMIVWDQFVGILRASIFAYAQVCNGNLGAGILAVTFLARLALLPVGVRLARAAWLHQEAMKRVQPELDAIRLKYKTDPGRVADETRRVLHREGVSAVPVAGCLGGVAQAPIFIALYSSVRQAVVGGGRFLWIGDIARPDWFVAIGATVFTVLSTANVSAASAQHRSAMMIVTAAVTLLALSKMAAGVGLYWGVSSLFGCVQGWVVQRSVRRMAQPPRGTRIGVA